MAQRSLDGKRENDRNGFSAAVTAKPRLEPVPRRSSNSRRHQRNNSIKPARNASLVTAANIHSHAYAEADDAGIEERKTRFNAMFDTERFIVEIEKRPAIYNVNCDEYNDRNAKMNAWDEVCQVMVPNWENLTDEERNVEGVLLATLESGAFRIELQTIVSRFLLTVLTSACAGTHEHIDFRFVHVGTVDTPLLYTIGYEKNLRGKWRNIRDYFMKELKLQRSKKPGPAGRKRKKYMYFDQLLFLMPTVETKRNSAGYISHFKSEESDGEMDNPVIEEYDIPLTHAGTSRDYLHTGTAFKTRTRYPKQLCEASLTSFDTEIQDMLSSHSSQRIVDEEDYDKMFLLSLLPILRQIPDEKKLDVRIQMQQVLAAALHLPNSN
ncbi:uncharacterized protein LOC107266853 isoform X1 [Cephus cinctus]|uniref:Uncharacterized protein LOC107266853 isoform X1 n=1 Tax=Cephus cinctus TaxID=211228 RepID=A0AAJ7BSK7_CEPCN|nr:uncharacterized protein LOC107266853 isoform X1 [Cephus cinctus]